MLSRLNHFWYRRQLLTYAEGHLAPAAAKKCLKHLKQCTRCQLLLPAIESLRFQSENKEAYRKLRLRQTLFEEVPERSVSLLGTGKRLAELRLYHKTALVTLGLCMVLVIGVNISTDWDEKAFHVKSAKTSTVSQHIRIDVYGRRDTTQLEKRSSVILKNDALAFAYTNHGPSPFQYLMLFGFDEHYTVYWFYPAYEDASEDPHPIPIRQGVGIELREEVLHHYEGKQLRVFACFLRTPYLTVKQVEREIATLKAAHIPIEQITSLPIVEGGFHSLLFKVE